MLCSRKLHVAVGWMFPDVSEERTASIFTLYPYNFSSILKKEAAQPAETLINMYYT
jgi:hypothetical protein